MNVNLNIDHDKSPDTNRLWKDEETVSSLHAECSTERKTKTCASAKTKSEKFTQNISEIFLQLQSSVDRWYNQRSSGSIAGDHSEDISKQLLLVTGVMANILISTLVYVVCFVIIGKRVDAYAKNVSSLEIESDSLSGSKSVSDNGENLVNQSSAFIVTSWNCFQSSSRF